MRTSNFAMANVKAATVTKRSPNQDLLTVDVRELVTIMPKARNHPCGVGVLGEVGSDSNRFVFNSGFEYRQVR